MSKPIYLSAKEAAAELGVQPATLYAYVSRGFVRSIAGPGRSKRYAAEDIRQLCDKREHGRETEADNFGVLLQSSITLITDDGPFYRGQPAINLAKNASLETVATLLWDCRADPFGETVENHDLQNCPLPARPVERAMFALSLWPLKDRTAYALNRDVLVRQGAMIMRLVVAALLNEPVSAAPMHEFLARQWGIDDPEIISMIRAALVLSADHELNTSAYAVRCAASTRAPLHAALLAGLGAFLGPRHGAASDRVESWLSAMRDPSGVRMEMEARVMRGEPLYGFGHLIYEDADPRADLLLSMIERHGLNRPFVDALGSIRKEALTLYGLHPNIDFALAALRNYAGLPDGAAMVLFCAGRMSGWIAHALEQYEQPDQIRPRATYTGQRPR
ncbi:MAG: citrate synthase family protein [Stappiaceae bacterium]